MIMRDKHGPILLCALLCNEKRELILSLISVTILIYKVCTTNLFPPIQTKLTGSLLLIQILQLELKEPSYFRWNVHFKKGKRGGKKSKILVT